MNKNLFVLKAACLFHDPPNKAWLIGYRDHKKEAKSIATEILKNTCLKEATEQMEETTKSADMLAASFDRWLLSKFVGEDYNLFPVKEIKLKNMFNPKFSKEVTQKHIYTNEFVEALKKVVENINDPRLAYHVLYAVYEPIWIKLGYPVGPADTRAPSHSVFDHNYATASIMNWLLGRENPQGILLYIDLGGPQRFIEGSRKLSDLWISSYLASALAWRIFWIFIRSLGPDVMILPTCRGNPFYYHSLASELIRYGVDETVIKEIKEISKDFTGYDPDRDRIPRYAVVPVTATFILPDLKYLKEFNDFKNIESIKDLEEFVKREYQEIWRSVYDKVVEKCRDLQGEMGNLAVEAERLLNECKQYGFDTTPPLPIRVIALHTDMFREMVKEENYNLYHYMFKLLSYEEGKRKLYKFRPEEDLRLFEMTSRPLSTWPKETDKGFEYCSVCGHLPAVIILPSDEKSYNNYLKNELEPVFGMGERLCPYCLIKRLIYMSPVLKSIMDELLGTILQELPRFRFPSVSDVALMPFKKSFITNLMRVDNIQGLANELAGWITEIWKKFIDKRILPIGREPITFIESKIAESIRTLKSDELKKNLEEILFMDAEACFLKTYKIERDGKVEYYNPRKDWLNIKERIYKDERIVKCMDFKDGKIEDLVTYYAIIKSDGDNLGKMIRGKIEEGFGISIKDYLCNILEGPSRKIIEAIINNHRELAKKVYEEHNVKEIDKKIDDLLKFVNELQGRKEIIVSPSYHSTLSRALMINAVRDKRIIDKYDGLTIYAGGDDLLAVTPVKSSLNAVQELREKFSFPLAGYKGFDSPLADKDLDVRDGYLISSLATASRSFSIYLTHYMFPMYSAIGRSAKLLDEIAKESKWVINSGKAKRKDTLILSYSPRGGDYYSLLPFSDVKALDQNQNLTKSLKYLNELVLLIEKEEFSSSLIYDFHNSLETIKPLINMKNEVLLRRLIERIFERNCEIQDEQLRKKMVEKWTLRLMEDYDVSVEVDDCSKPFLDQFLLALMLYRSSLRGVE